MQPRFSHERFRRHSRTTAYLGSRSVFASNAFTNFSSRCRSDSVSDFDCTALGSSDASSASRSNCTLSRSRHEFSICWAVALPAAIVLPTRRSKRVLKKPAPLTRAPSSRQKASAVSYASLRYGDSLMASSSSSPNRSTRIGLRNGSLVSGSIVSSRYFRLLRTMCRINGLWSVKNRGNNCLTRLWSGGRKRSQSLPEAVTFESSIWSDRRMSSKSRCSCRGGSGVLTHSHRSRSSSGGSICLVTRLSACSARFHLLHIPPRTASLPLESTSSRSQASMGLS